VERRGFAQEWNEGEGARVIEARECAAREEDARRMQHQRLAD